jgi:fucose 4-O-acetylase-like acetyltransferase
MSNMLFAIKDINREKSLDVARGIAMALVIYGHILQIFFHKRPDGVFSQVAFLQWQAIYGFHMPLFFLISGAIKDQFEEKGWRDVILRSLFFILLAYLIDLVGLVSTVAIAPLTVPSVKDYIVDHILRAETFTTVTPWYLVSFAIVRPFAFALTRISVPNLWALVLALSASFAAAYAFDQSFHWRSLAPGVVFFMIGRWLAMREIVIDPWIGALCLAIALWLAHFNGGCTFPWETSCENTELPGYFCVLLIFGFLGSLPLFFVTAALGSFGVMSLSRWLASFKLSSVFAFFGKNSLDLFLINGFVLVFINPILRGAVGVHENILFYSIVACAALLGHVCAFYAFRPVLSVLKSLALSGATSMVRLWETFFPFTDPAKEASPTSSLD